MRLTWIFPHILVTEYFVHLKGSQFVLDVLSKNGKGSLVHAQYGAHIRIKVNYKT